MTTDPFASIRRRSADAPCTDYASVPIPGDTLAEVAPNPRISAALPKIPLLPSRNTETRSWKQLADDLQREWGMPRTWAEGVAALHLMDIPDGAAEWRWRQVVSDATAFATGWHDEAVRGGWSIEDVFGFDPDDDDTTLALVVALRGRRSMALSDGSVIAIASDGVRRCFYPGRGAAGLAPVWMINRSRRERRQA